MGIWKLLSAALAILGAVGSVEHGARAAEFYEGKQLTLLVNFTPGGPTDAEARVLARHLAKHIPGKPTILVRNMGGAGGAIGANWLGQVAQPDGLTLGYLAGVAAIAAIDDPAIKVDVAKFPFVASGASINILFARTDTGGGLQRPADLLNKENFWAAGLSADSSKDIRMRMQLDLLGISYKYITGYKGTAEMRLALQQGEIHVMNESLPTYRSLIEPSLVKTGAVIPLWYSPLDDGKTISPSPDAEGIDALPYHEFYREVRGKLPEGDLWEAYRFLNQVGAVFQRVLLMPPGSPAAAITALEEAMTKVQDDPEYKEDARKALSFVPRYSTGERLAQLFRQQLNADPNIKSFVRTYVEQAKARSEPASKR